LNIKLSKQLESETRNGGSFAKYFDGINKKEFAKKAISSIKKKRREIVTISRWNYVVPFIIFAGLFLTIFSSLFNLQVVKGKELYERSVNNKLEVTNIPANRGVIFDRNGNKIAENIPSINITIDLREYKKDDGIDYNLLRGTLERVDKILPEKYKKQSSTEKVFTALDKMNETEKVLARTFVLAHGVDNETAIQVKSKYDELKGITVDNASQRYYSGGLSLAHILGYTGDVYAEDLEKLDYVDFDDVIGKSGVEKVYDKELFGLDGKKAVEVDGLGNVVADNDVIISEPKSGQSLYLSIDKNAQNQMYKILEKGSKTYKATGAAGILEDVNTGEIIVMTSYPGYDNNKFIGGISAKEYSRLLNDKRAPLNNRPIAAQIPPGSTFKTIIAAASLDAGAIDRSTVYVSRANYTFSNGARFQEYQDHVYGPLTVVDALSVSSNLFFCEVIRNWDMNELVPYLEKFGIGQYTYIDVPGEGSGTLPSPANKIKLANSTNPWLDPIWYPEGDSCNSVIGQGITTVTPIQMVNWISAIANGGTLNTPHVAKRLVSPDGSESDVQSEPLRKNIISSSALKIVREGMWASVNGPRRVVFPLTDAKVEVAGKTGTAEFGKVNSKGIYEHTHAWVTGFFPYDKPKYAFTIFMEDGGESYNAAKLAREFIDWWVGYGKK